MRMTFNSTQASGFRHLAPAATVALLAMLLVAGCGRGKEQEAVAQAEQDKAAQTEPAAEVPATPPANAAEKESRMATAVADGKTTAPVDMKYDVPSKPGLGEPFEVELVFDTRSPADVLDVEITEAPGLTLVGEKTLKFAPVEGGQSYTAKLLAKGDAPGLYYIGVVAKMSTKVQTESRAFAIPVVIGDPPAAQKVTPATDATGQAVQSMPAQEPK